MTSVDNEHELNKEQLRTLVEISGQNEARIQKEYNDLLTRYPKGFLTKEEFTRKFCESELFNSAYKKLYPSQYLFEVMDQNNSGTIDVYEIMLACVTLQSEDPKTLFDCIFKMLDSNADGQLTQDELVNVLYDYLNMVTYGGDHDEKKGSQYTLEQIKRNIEGAFGDMEIISKKDLRDNEEKSEILHSMFLGLRNIFTLGLLDE